MDHIEPNEIVFSQGAKNSNDQLIKWFSNKQIYTSGQIIPLAVGETSAEYVTPNGCIGYSIFIEVQGFTAIADPILNLTINGVPFKLAFKDDATILNLPVYKSPCYPYVEIKDAISIGNPQINNVNISVNLVYYRLKYRDR